MTTSAEQRTTSRGLLYLIISGLAGIALIAAFLIVAPSVSADPSTVTVNVQFENNLGAPLAGGTAYYASNGWQQIGTTDNTGTLTVSLVPGTYTFRMDYKGMSEQFSQQISAAGPNTVVFQTERVAVYLQADTGAGVSGATMYYAANGWQTIGTTGSSGAVVAQMLPGAYTFRVDYNGASNQKVETISLGGTNNGQAVWFHTVLVQVHLENNLGGPLSGGTAYYAANGWQLIGTTDSTGITSAQVLPGNYTFRMDYNGMSEQQSATIAQPNFNLGLSDPASNRIQNVVFQTERVAVYLQSDTGGPVGGATMYYAANGWQLIGTTNANTGAVVAQMLPGAYTFRVDYNGASDQKMETISLGGTNNGQAVWFHTVLVQVHLENNYGTAGLAGGTAYYAANGWQLIGTTDSTGIASAQVLPGNYTFRMDYKGMSEQQSAITIAQPNFNLPPSNPSSNRIQNVVFQYPFN